jgi:hypothetical protein
VPEPGLSKGGASYVSISVNIPVVEQGLIPAIGDLFSKGRIPADSLMIDGH